MPSDDAIPCGHNFARALTAAVEQRGLTLQRLNARLHRAGAGVSVATLSYWQTGRSLPTRSRSQRTLDALEDVLGMPSGTLVDLVTVDRRERRPYAAGPWDLFAQFPAIAEIVAEMGLCREALTRIAVHDRLHIDADRRSDRETSRQVLRAKRSRIARWPIAYIQDGEGVAAPQLEARSGCRIGETITVPQQRLTVAEVILPRLLERGELAVIDLLVHWDRGSDTSRRLQRRCTDPTREVITEVQFHRDTLPRRVVGYQGIAPRDEVTDDQTDTSVLDGLAQRVVVDVPPGVQGLRWEWD